MLLGEHVPTDCSLASFLHLTHLRGQSRREVLEPDREVHVPLADALDRLVVRVAIAVVVLADGEQPLEVVPRLVQAERRKQPCGTSIPVDEWVDVDELKLGDPRHDDWIRLPLRADQETRSTIMGGTSCGGGGV